MKLQTSSQTLGKLLVYVYTYFNAIIKHVLTLSSKKEPKHFECRVLPQNCKWNGSVNAM